MLRLKTRENLHGVQEAAGSNPVTQILLYTTTYSNSGHVIKTSKLLIVADDSSARK